MKMDQPALGAITAEREFEALDAAGKGFDIVLRIGTPVPDTRPDGDWCCPYQITGLPDSRVSMAFGIDSLQAFLLVLVKARAELTLAQRTHGLRLTWLEQDDWGLPTFEKKT